MTDAVAIDYVREAVFYRALEIVLSPYYIGRKRQEVDIRRPLCVKLTARRHRCEYRFTIDNLEHDIIQYDEHGSAIVSRSGVRLRPRPALLPTRDGFVQEDS